MGVYAQERQSSRLRKFSISNEVFRFRSVLMNNFCFLQKVEPFVEQTILGNFLYSLSETFHMQKHTYIISQYVIEMQNILKS